MQWGATGLLSAAFGGSGLLGKMLLEVFNSSLDEVANVSVNGDVQMASEVGPIKPDISSIAVETTRVLVYIQ